MTTRPFTEIVHEAGYAAEVDVELIETDGEGGWSPYLSLDDAMKLDRVTRALRRGDPAEAAKDARVFKLMPVLAGAELQKGL